MFTCTLPDDLPRMIANHPTPPPSGRSPFAGLRGTGESPEEAFAGLLVAINVVVQWAGDDRLPEGELLVHFDGPGFTARRDMHQLKRISQAFAAEMDHLRQEFERTRQGSPPRPWLHPAEPAAS